MQNETLDLFKFYVGSAVYSLGTRTKRVYEQTYAAWLAWCARGTTNPLDLNDVNVERFLRTEKLTYATLTRHRSALRKLANVMAKANPTNPNMQRAAEELERLTIPRDNLGETSHRLHELTPDQADHAISVWSGKDPIQLRNRTIVSLLLTTGIRRSEIHKLRRTDINLTYSTIHVENKEYPDASHEIAIPSATAIQALQSWLGVLDPKRTYIFPSIDKVGRLGPDNPMSDQAIYKVIQETKKRSGLVFSLQDTRRTFLIEALANDSPLTDVQAQAGHRDISSTLRYSKTRSAAERRKRLKLRYGSKG